MGKRTFKFYRKNEAEVMERLGLKPTKNSGSGWIEKEDGQNDYVICQLKSTDAQSIKVNQKDIRILEKNALVEHKLPVFAIQFLNTGEVWLMARPEDFMSVSEYIQTGNITDSTNLDLGIDLSEHEDLTTYVERRIASSQNARKKFHQEKEAKYDRTRKAT